MIENPKTIISIRKVSKFFGKHKVLEDISLDIKENEVIVIIGPSGSGKSTLLRCLNKLETINEGDILIDEKNINEQKFNDNKLREKVVMVFQQFNLFANMSVEKNITLGPEKLQGLSIVQAERISKSLLSRVGLLDKKDVYPENLSGGQKQRIAIARALALKPKVILFDEPTSALDPEMVDEVLTVMKETVLEGLTAVIVTHEMGFARDVADRIIFMDQGKILAELLPSQLNSAHKNPRIAEFLKKIE